MGLLPSSASPGLLSLLSDRQRKQIAVQDSTGGQGTVDQSALGKGTIGQEQNRSGYSRSGYGRSGIQ